MAAKMKRRERKWKLHDAIEVRWWDAHARIDQPWIENAEDIDHPPTVRTRGFVLSIDKDYLNLCMGFCGDKEHGRFSIPLGCIRKLIRR